MTTPPDELVALYDVGGGEIGSAPRSRVRAENRHHAAAAVVVLDGGGRVYLHRRTDTKDVYPGLLDFTAGGVLQAGEAPGDAARRELAEELGVRGATLAALGRQTYTDAHTSYEAFRYATTYAGPITWQAEEVAWGAWVPIAEVAALLEDPESPLVPDARAVLGPWLRTLAG